jgi:hypothetical protein
MLLLGGKVSGISRKGPRTLVNLANADGARLATLLLHDCFTVSFFCISCTEFFPITDHCPPKHALGRGLFETKRDCMQNTSAAMIIVSKPP